MTYTLEQLSDSSEQDYCNFVNGFEHSSLYISLPYRNLMKVFTKAQPYYFIARDTKNNIIGVLPSFMHASDKGNVLNSLPFYGSNGGVISSLDNGEVKHFLIEGFNDFAVKNNCFSSTIISSPHDEDLSAYKKYCSATFVDERTGQLTPVPTIQEDAETEIMSFFHSKNRNMIRKAQKSGVTVSCEPCDGDIEFLYSTHVKNMSDIGGAAKPKRFFDEIEKIFSRNKEYKIYKAYLDGARIASLLIFCFNKTVEYFTPVIDKGHRSIQPMSLIIFEAFKDAALTGYNWWNWGGTWASQEGVHRFKKSWGAIDKPYYYYTKIYNEGLLNKTPAELLNNFPYFFVLPFDKLKSEGGAS